MLIIISLNMTLVFVAVVYFNPPTTINQTQIHKKEKVSFIFLKKVKNRVVDNPLLYL